MKKHNCNVVVYVDGKMHSILQNVPNKRLNATLTSSFPSHKYDLMDKSKVKKDEMEVKFTTHEPPSTYHHFY